MRYLPDSDTCFCCGRINPSGLRIRFRLEGEEVRTTFVPDQFRCGYKNVVHGGVLSALLDETMGWAPCYHKKRFCFAAEIRIRFVRPAPGDQPLTVIGRMTADRGRIWEAEGEIVGEDGTVYARGWGKYVPLSAEETEDVLNYLHFEEDTVTRADLLPA